ncbi:hypothetical protein BZA05DRAFT_382175 [Tricharina praecox]|uniref:uncharacterized protein n=1 Tax=Tricharina praecox TaxID=43433 RepID=UPI0022207771|nr:uncharacterized protein BZA05DRAFT_382175 [Tricharina praecox]KAI5858698.1 hypothetical protein BZA05DRAFT_382175 [Tricharina praecox]
MTPSFSATMCHSCRCSALAACVAYACCVHATAAAATIVWYHRGTDHNSLVRRETKVKRRVAGIVFRGHARVCVCVSV